MLLMNTNKRNTHVLNVHSIISQKDCWFSYLQHDVITIESVIVLLISKHLSLETSSPFLKAISALWGPTNLIT